MKMNEEDKQTLRDCIDILTNRTCNYQKTALQLRAILNQNNIL